MALNLCFDANELPQRSNGIRPYFVPDGRVACHGINCRTPVLNLPKSSRHGLEMRVNRKIVWKSGLQSVILFRLLFLIRGFS
jgi:hypothetical protein